MSRDVEEGRNRAETARTGRLAEPADPEPAQVVEPAFGRRCGARRVVFGAWGGCFEAAVAGDEKARGVFVVAVKGGEARVEAVDEGAQRRTFGAVRARAVAAAQKLRPFADEASVFRAAVFRPAEIFHDFPIVKQAGGGQVEAAEKKMHGLIRHETAGLAVMTAEGARFPRMQFQKMGQGTHVAGFGGVVHDERVQPGNGESATEGEFERGVQFAAQHEVERLFRIKFIGQRQQMPQLFSVLSGDADQHVAEALPFNGCGHAIPPDSRASARRC